MNYLDTLYAVMEKRAYEYQDAGISAAEQRLVKVKERARASEKAFKDALDKAFATAKTTTDEDDFRRLKIELKMAAADMANSIAAISSSASGLALEHAAAATNARADAEENNWRNIGIGTGVGLGVGAGTYAGLGMNDTMRKQPLLRSLTALAVGGAAGGGAYYFGDNIQAGASNLWNAAFGKNKEQA